MGGDEEGREEVDEEVLRCGRWRGMWSVEGVKAGRRWESVHWRKEEEEEETDRER